MYEYALIISQSKIQHIIMKVAVIGVGYWGIKHVEEYLSLFTRTLGEK